MTEYYYKGSMYVKLIANNILKDMKCKKQKYYKLNKDASIVNKPLHLWLKSLQMLYNPKSILINNLCRLYYCTIYKEMYKLYSSQLQSLNKYLYHISGKNQSNCKISNGLWGIYYKQQLLYSQDNILVHNQYKQLYCSMQDSQLGMQYKCRLHYSIQPDIHGSKWNQHIMNIQ